MGVSGGDLGDKGDPELPGVDFWMHSGGHEDANGSDMGAKWEPNAVKMLINIVAKFAIDLGGHCVRFAQTAAACKAILRIRGEIK